MSNRTVPQFFNSVVNEVTKNIESDFREYGVSQDVLNNLKQIWMEKIIQSHVADFQAETVTVAQPPPAHPGYAAHAMTGMMLPAAYVPQGAAYANPVKNEPLDPRFTLGIAQAAAAYSLPSLPGPQLGARTATNASASPVMAYQANRYTPSNGTTATTAATSSSTPRIPQVDGPSNYDESEDDDEDSGPSQPQYAPRTLHPSLPQPQQPQPKASADDEAINSDLDDSDDEEGGGDENGGAESDIMFCTYDKVARVKNKWKCVLKDGVVHVNGKDYLFQKCTGEFEW